MIFFITFTNKNVFFWFLLVEKLSANTPRPGQQRNKSKTFIGFILKIHAHARACIDIWFYYLSDHLCATKDTTFHSFFKMFPCSLLSFSLRLLLSRSSAEVLGRSFDSSTCVLKLAISHTSTFLYSPSFQVFVHEGLETSERSVMFLVPD